MDARPDRGPRASAPWLARHEVKVSIVVPALDEEPRLADALAPLARLRDAGHEVIVVDGGSSDRTCDVAMPLADRVLVAPRGRAIQMNTGAASASGAYLLFLHADCLLPARGVAAIEGTRFAGRRWGRFDVRIAGRSPLLPVVATLMNLRSAITGICTGDQGMFVERALFDEVGGFPAIPLMGTSRSRKRCAARRAGRNA
jgi:rSAM/selenodomain-associated transferase 2